MKIRTLSLEGYVKRFNTSGYAAALCLPDENDTDPTTVIEQFMNASNYPESTRVNVATGAITQPGYLRGLLVTRQASDMRDFMHPVTRQPLYVVLSTPAANALLRQRRERQLATHSA